MDNTFALLIFRSLNNHVLQIAFINYIFIYKDYGVSNDPNSPFQESKFVEKICVKKYLEQNSLQGLNF